jgi:peptide/nickel transport system substrate-binding protein
MSAKRIWLVGVACLLGLSLAAVGNAQTRGGTVRIMLTVDAEGGIDPHKRITSNAEVMDDQMYDTLIEYETATDQFRPALAESWQASADGRTYTFRLRRGVRFHNGRELNAADVKYSFERIMDPRTASPRRLTFSPVERIDTPDARTVTFTLKGVYAPFLANLAHITSAIVPREAVEQHGDLTRTAVGTGAFRLKEWEKDNFMRLERNPTYWRSGLPYLDGLEFRFNADRNAQVAALRSGQITFLRNIDPAFVRTVRMSDQFQVVGGQSNTYAYLYMNTNRRPFSDARVRQAINWAMDLDAIRRNAVLGFGVSLKSGILPPDHWGGIKEPVYPRQDLDRARALLSEAGVRGGTFNITVVTITPANIRAAETIQQQLQPLGIAIEVRVLEPAPMLRAAFSADFDMLILHGNFGIDPDDHLSQVFLTGAGSNWIKYSDPELDALIERARLGTSRADRARVYRDIVRRIATQGPRAGLYIVPEFHAFTSTLRGFKFEPAPSFRSLREAWFAQ